MELLNEYVNIRRGELIPEGLPETFTNEYTKDMIKSYLEDPHSFSKAERNKINDDLMKIGIDLEYRKYLKMFDQDSDCFAVILDRDCGNHSRQLMIECIEICKERGYGCYISNPCFEFWLLLHLCDVKLEYADRLTELLVNKKISKRHTYVSNEVSQRAHHNKQINANVFLEKYLPQIPQAINNSKGFALDLEEILDELGSNLSELFQIIGYDGD